MSADDKRRVTEALQILTSLGMPRAQQNERSALCLLALLDVTPQKTWRQAESPLIGITPIMDWARQHYHKDYAPNTRETIRRQTMHQFVDAGIAAGERAPPFLRLPLLARGVTLTGLDVDRGEGNWVEAMSLLLQVVASES